MYAAGLLHACRNGTGFSARCSTQVQYCFAGRCPQCQSTDLGGEILHIEPALAEFRQFANIAGVQFIGTCQICGTNGISQCLFQFCTGACRRILPDKPRSRLESVRQKCLCGIHTISVHQLFQQPLGNGIFHSHCRLGIFRVRNLAVVPQETAEHRIDKAGRTGFPAASGQLDAFIDCCTAGDLVAVEKLVNAQTENVPHGAVQLPQGLLAVVRKHRI